MMNPEVKLWLDLAKQDHGVAGHLYKTYYPKPYEIICYHCQQAAEKAIKAVLLSCDLKDGLPKSHDLSFLLNQIKNIVKIDEKILDYADTLTPYGISVRYPNELFLEDHHAAAALEMARDVIAWSEKQIEDRMIQEG